MSDPTIAPKADSDWRTLRASAETTKEGAGWTAQHYRTLVELIMHCDRQISTTNRFHMTAIGSLVPILAILLKIQVPLYTLVGVLLLGTAVSIRWLTRTSKLNIEKLCWVSLVRAVEKECLVSPPGPFNEQQAYFRDLPEELSTRHQFIMRRVGTRRLYFLSAIILVFGFAAAAWAAVMGALKLPF
jgi:hypothetical protein